MVSVHDVAAFILTKQGAMTAMKLQKLVYYAQAWSLVWDETRLFPETIEAWANGPVVPALYRAHRGKFIVTASDFPTGKPEAVIGDARDTVLGVLKFYGEKDPEWLSDLTHREKPWLDARKGLEPGERGDSEITIESMGAYYSEL